MEHRWGQRVPMHFGVKLTCVPHAIGVGRFRDVSISGAFIETNLRPPLFSCVRVEVQVAIKHRVKKYAISGFVMRSDEHGIGIEWQTLAPACVAELIGIQERDHVTETEMDDVSLLLHARAAEINAQQGQTKR